MKEKYDDPELCEYLVKIDWIKTFPQNQAVWLKGMVINQNSGTPLRHKFTLSQLSRLFAIEPG